MYVFPNTLKPLYKKVPHKMVSNLRQYNGGPQKCCIQTKLDRLYGIMTIYVNFSI